MIPNIHRHDEIVRTLRLFHAEGFESAIIAGGAVRDLYFQLMPRDIDIFLWDPRYSSESVGQGHYAVDKARGKDVIWRIMNLRQAHNQPTIADDQISHTFRHGYGGNPSITNIYNVLKNFIPFQLIFLKENPLAHLNNHFDFGICKCYCDGYKFRFTRDFMHDVKHQKITLVAKDMTDDEYRYATTYHLPKIQAKFPGFRYEVAPWNNQLVAKHKKK